MFILRCSVVVFAFFVAACGTGQPADTGEHQGVKQARNTVVIEGRAAQGTLEEARIDIYALKGDIRRHLGKGYTDDQGDFALELDQANDPLLLEVTAAGDGRSRMVCGALDGCGEAAFGETRPLPGDFRLTTLVMPGEPDGQPVAITPLTHMATGWARALPGPVDAASLRLARDRMAGLMHLSADFAFQRVPAITGDNGSRPDSAAGRHALMAVAFAERAANSDRTLQKSLDGHLEAFINHDGQLRREGDYSLRGLLVSAGEIAAQRDILPGAQKNLRMLVASAAGSQNRLARAEGAL